MDEVKSEGGHHLVIRVRVRVSRRRMTRNTAAKKRGGRIINTEPVEVKCCNAKMVTPCGSFVYLGSLTNNKDESGMEIRRRIVEEERSM